MYVFQSESTLYSHLNVKELLVQNRGDIWSLSNSNEIQTHSHLGLRLNVIRFTYTSDIKPVSTKELLDI